MCPAVWPASLLSDCNMPISSILTLKGHKFINTIYFLHKWCILFAEMLIKSYHCWNSVRMAFAVIPNNSGFCSQFEVLVLMADNQAFVSGYNTIKQLCRVFILLKKMCESFFTMCLLGNLDFPCRGIHGLNLAFFSGETWIQFWFTLDYTWKGFWLSPLSLLHILSIRQS